MIRPFGIQFGFGAFEHYASDTAWLMHSGLRAAGIPFFGRNAPDGDTTDIRAVCQELKPDIVFLQGWNCWKSGSGQKPSAEVAGGDVELSGYEWLAEQAGILRVTNLDDPSRHKDLHEEWHRAFKPHVVIVRYEERDILRDHPWLRPEQLLRMWHSVTAEYCPPVRPRDGICLFSGCTHPEWYPMRHRLAGEIRDSGLEGSIYTVRPHHGWQRGVGTAVPEYMAALAQHRVAIVTTCVKHWALKKHFEATAAGCIVVTNLPDDQEIPVIDGNLVRVPDDVELPCLTRIVARLAEDWQAARQRRFARLAVEHYDYRVAGARAAAALRLRWKELFA